MQLDEYQRQMRDAETESHEGKRKQESVWPIMRIQHTRSRWIYELYYKREAISRELYDWLCEEKYADVKCALLLCDCTAPVLLAAAKPDSLILTLAFPLLHFPLWDRDSLIAKWKKQGYEKLCCLRCIQTSVCASRPTLL